MCPNLAKLARITLFSHCFLLLFVPAAIGQVSGTGTEGGTASSWLTSAVNPLPTATLTASNLSPTQGNSITLTYASTNTTHCNISQGILADTVNCNGTTTLFLPPFSAPGPTSTSYTFTVFNASGQVGVSVLVVVSAAVASGDDSVYSTGTSETCAYPAGATTDGPATLPIVCNDTRLADETSGGTVRTVGYSGGVLTAGTCVSDWNTAMAALVAGDVVKVAQGCVIVCGNATGCILASVHGDWAHWTLIESVDPATGNPDVGFPAEGKRITPCDIGLASAPYYPDYSADCIARGGAKNRTFKIISSSATTPALAVFDNNPNTPTCNVTTYPCASFIRIIGMENTNKDAGTRTSHKLFEMNGGAHIIADRIIQHSLNDPNFRVEVNGGVGINGSNLSVINSWIYDIACANAATGSTCVDSQAIAGGTQVFPQAGHKIVNNFLASAGESWFWGGAGTGYYPAAGNPDGAATDQEIRRNHTMHPLSWFLPYQGGPFTLSSVNTTGTYTGIIFGGTSNALVGRTYKVAGFLNAGNNISARLVTGSTNTTISFAGTTTLAETHAGTATNSEPHWDTKNLGETKDTNRSLWEGNVSEQSHIGFQSDQFGNAYLFTPKNQGVKLPIPAGDVLTGSTVGGLHYLNCTNGGIVCSTVSAGKSLFTCELDPNAVPDWTGNGTTVASCGGIVAFGCTAGTQVGCPGSYVKLCQSVSDTTKCGMDIGGTTYHILAVVSVDKVQILEDTTAITAVTPVIFRRGLNPFASVRNMTIRYSILRHLGDCIENSSAADDGGSEAKGVHNVSIHDNVCYDVNPGFWSNQSSCCNSGWFVKMFSGTAIPTVTPDHTSIVHNTASLIGFGNSAASGLTNMFDNRCKLPLTGLICSAGNSPAYFPALEIRDNISASAMHMTASASAFATNTQAFAAGFYGCSGHDGVTGCDYNIQKNLIPLGLWPNQLGQTPNLHKLGTNTVEACSCTTVANGGTCTPGSPNTWSAPVTSGTLDACDRIPASGYASIFNNWDPNGGASIDLQLPSNSQYKGAASDGGDLGADIGTILTKTAGVALPIPITQIAINGFVGGTTCSDIAPCALPAATHGVPYSQTLSRTVPNGPWTQWTQVSGTLPAGLQLILGTGVVWGTPNVAGSYSFSFQAQDGAHSVDTQSYRLTVN